jgi:hypothetical protein
MSWYRAPLWDLRPDITSFLKFAVMFLCDAISDERKGSAICSAITQWSESRRTRNHSLLSHLRLFQSAGPSSRIYIPLEQGGPVIGPGTGFNTRRYDSQPKLWSLKKDVSDLQKTTEKGGRWRSGLYPSSFINDVEDNSLTSTDLELRNIWWQCCRTASH